MTGFESKRKVAQAKLNDEADTLLIVYQRGFSDGKQAAQPPAEWESIKNIIAEYGLQAIDFVADWKAAQQQAEPVQERVTHITWDERGVRTVNGMPDDAPQRSWVGLTPKEILDLFDVNNVYGSKWIKFARTVEAKLRSKNDH